MVTTNQGGQNKQSASAPYQGDQMPYRMPRGAERGSRVGLHIAEVLAVVLAVVLFVAVAYMAHWQWG